MSAGAWVAWSIAMLMPIAWVVSGSVAASSWTDSRRVEQPWTSTGIAAGLFVVNVALVALGLAGVIR